MAETRKVWEFAEAFKQQYPSLNELVGVAFLLESSILNAAWMTPSLPLRQINNAGCMVHKRELNAEGLEMNFATNTMGETFIVGITEHCTGDGVKCVTLSL